MGSSLSALAATAGVPGLLKLCDPWIVHVDPGTALEPGLRCGVDAPAFIHPLLQRHRASVMLNDGWPGFDRDTALLLNRLRRNSTGGTLDVIFDGVRLEAKEANASRPAHACN